MPGSVKAGAVAVAVILLGVAGGWLHVAGIKAGQAACEADNAAATEELNDKLRELRTEADRAARDYLRRVEELTFQEGELNRERMADPDSARACLGSNGVRRVNSIR